MRSALAIAVTGALVVGSSATTIAAAPGFPPYLAAATRPAISGPTGLILDLALDEPGKLLYALEVYNAKVWAFSLPTLTPMAVIDLGGTADGMDLSRDRTMLAVARQAPGDIVLINTANLTVIQHLVPTDGSSPMDVGFRRAGLLYSVGFASTSEIHVFDVNTGKQVGQSAPGHPPDAFWLEISADGNTLYDNEVTQQGTEQVARYDASSLTPLFTGVTPTAGGGYTFAIKPDGSRVFGPDGKVWSGDLHTFIGT